MYKQENLEDEVFANIKNSNSNSGFFENKGEGAFKRKEKREKTDVIQVAFDNINRDQDLSICCETGSDKDIQKMIQILNLDPKKYLLLIAITI